MPKPPAFLIRCTVALTMAVGIAGAAAAQPTLALPPGGDVPRPPGLIPNAPAPAQPAPPAEAPPTALVPPGGPVLPAFPGTRTPPPPGGTATPRAPGLPPSATTRPTLSLSARYGANLPAIQNGLHWRVYADRPDAAGSYPMVAESRDAAPSFPLSPGGYVVHATYGLAGITRRVTIGLEGTREQLTIPAGGLRMRGVVGETTIPQQQIVFEVFRGSQFDSGDKRLVAGDIAQGDVVLLPEGTYHIVSNYGDTNAVVRSDVRVQAGRLSDATVHHRAASITLKLVSAEGREALANTAWSVLTPGGDVIKESIGALPVVVLAEGDYVAIARNEGKTYQREFKVEPGVDREIEVLARDPVPQNPPEAQPAAAAGPPAATGPQQPR